MARSRVSGFILGDVDAQHRPRQHKHVHLPLPRRSRGDVADARWAGAVLGSIHDAPGTPLNLHPTQEELQQILDERIGGITITQSHWLTCFEIHHGQVPGYRYGRVFLAGDAAHIHSPAGGQGMNTGMQDAFNLAWKLVAVIRGEGGQTLLDSYNAERHPVGAGVIGFTSLLTKAGTLKGGARRVRDAVIQAASSIAPATRKMAGNVEETNINYRDSALAVGRRLRHAKVVAGEHVPHMSDPELQKQLRAACGQDNTGHTVLTCDIRAAGQVAPAAGGPGQTQLLVTADNTPVAGYDAVIADPNGAVARRFGLKTGGRVVIRPDGYIGAVASLNDTTTVAAYYAKARS